MNFVPLDHLNVAEELRITAEISLSIGLTFLGYYLSSKQYLWVAIVFTFFAIISFTRFFLKRRSLCNFEEPSMQNKQRPKV